MGPEDTTMTVPVWVEQSNGKFTATVLGAPQVKAEGATKEQAVAAVTAQLRDRVTTGEVVLVDVPPAPLPFRQVSPEEAAAWRELCEEIYRERDAQKAAEFPE
jgi:hypothetical protein